MIIGIDIGGTNTDAVLIDEKGAIITFAKSPTTEDIADGVEKVLIRILSGIEVRKIRAIIVGTTHATNAILERKDLFKVGVLRLAGQFPSSPPPCYGWPQELKNAILCGYEVASGGYECHGALIQPLDLDELREKIKTLLKAGMESLAVVGVFSPMNRDQEVAVGKLAQEMNLSVSLSHEIGGVGFLERENSTILNAALKKVMKKGFSRLEEICKKMGLLCPLHVTQNNGSRISINQAIEHPILTLSAGPTNSFVGASKLCDLTDAVVIDIGGTSTDIGLIKNGVLRRSLNASDIGGVKLNLPMPDVISLAIGGGSHVNLESLQIGPLSVGKEITTKAMSFGGKQLILTDLAIAAAQISMDGANRALVPLSKVEAQALLQKVLKKIEEHISFASAQILPILLVGGGSALIPSEFLDKRFIVPKHAAVANAFGAALSGIAGTVDQVVSLQNETLVELKEKAIQAAIEKGARKETIQVADIQIIPYHYVPNNMARVIVTAFGSE